MSPTASAANSPPALDAAAIQQAHRLYCQLTGQTLSLGFDRERMWYELLRAGYTLQDLRAVIVYLQREIRAQRRNVGALNRSAACACARHHHSHHQIPTANNRAVNARWSACANSKLHSTELPYYYHYLSWPSCRSTAQHQKLSTQKVRQNPRTPTRQTLHSPIQGYSPFQPESA